MIMTQQQELWRAVLIRAMVDALYVGKSPMSLQEKEEAHAWIMAGDGDFEYVCFMAGYDPEYVRSRYTGGRMRPRAPRGRQAHSLPANFSLTGVCV